MEIFNCLKGKTYLPRLPGIFLIARHFQKQLEVVCFISLFRAAEGKRNNRSKVLKSVYSLQPKGEQHLGGYNFQRTMDELIEGLNEKVEEKEVEKEEEEKEVEPAEKRRKLDENESDETRLG